MTTPPDPHESHDAEEPRGEQPSADERAAANVETGGRLGGMLGRLARRALPEAERLAQRAREVGEQVARDARPEAERLAQRAREAGEHARPEAERLAAKARAAAEAARPHVERAGRDAVRYVRDHDDELKRAGKTAAEFAAFRAVPLPLQPLIRAVEREVRPRPPLRDDRTSNVVDTPDAGHPGEDTDRRGA